MFLDYDPRELVIERHQQAKRITNRNTKSNTRLTADDTTRLGVAERNGIMVDGRSMSQQSNRGS
jgi:hypothetical protein